MCLCSLLFFLHLWLAFCFYFHFYNKHEQRAQKTWQWKVVKVTLKLCIKWNSTDDTLVSLPKPRRRKSNKTQRAHKSGMSCALKVGAYEGKRAREKTVRTGKQIGKPSDRQPKTAKKYCCHKNVSLQLQVSFLLSWLATSWCWCAFPISCDIANYLRVSKFVLIIL